MVAMEPNAAQPLHKSDLNGPAIFILSLLHGLAIVVLALAGLWVFASSLPILWVAVLAIGFNAAMYVWSGLGVTMGYHRLFTHRSFKANKVLEVFLLLGGGMSLEGDAIGWVDTHRTHHQYADTIQDPHSPYRYGGSGPWVNGPATWKGFWWAHLLWMFHRYTLPEKRTGVKDLSSRKLFQVQKRYILVLAVATFALPALSAGAIGFLLGGLALGLLAFVATLGLAIIRLVLLLNATWSINSATHIWGRRSIDDEDQLYRVDESRNILWLWLVLLTFGECIHGHHHAKQNSADNAWNPGEFDPTGLLIRGFDKLGLVWNVNYPRAGGRPIRFSERQCRRPDGGG